MSPSAAALVIMLAIAGVSQALSNAPTYKFLSNSIPFDYASIRSACQAEGAGWDIVSIQSKAHVEALVVEATAAGVDLTVAQGVPLGYDKNANNRYYDLRDQSREVTSIFDELAADGWGGDHASDQTTGSCPQVFAGFGWGTQEIHDYGICHGHHKILCEGPPTNALTNAPTAVPTDAPTNAPTGAPTDAPTNAPTNAPTYAPTNAPTNASTNAPTGGPCEDHTKCASGEKCKGGYKVAKKCRQKKKDCKLFGHHFIKRWGCAEGESCSGGGPTAKWGSCVSGGN